MKKLITGFFLFALCGTSLFAQQLIDDATASKRTVGSFHGIDVATGIRLMLTQGGVEEVAVSAATTAFRDKIITKVENGILKIYYESKTGAVNTKKETKDLKAYVSYKLLDQLTATTGARVNISGVLQAAELSMNANTGAEINGEVNITGLTVHQNTGSKITLSGTAVQLKVEGDTGSKFKGEDMSTSSCSVKVSTGAIVSVRADKELQVKASSGGNVKYKGDASIREIKTSSGGSVSKI